MTIRALITILAIVLSGCGSVGSTVPAQSTGIGEATAAPTAAADSVVCDFFDEAHGHVVAAASAAFMDENEAAPTRAAIDAIEAVAARAQDPTEKADLEVLARAMDAAALSGEGYLGWTDAYEAFFVKYGPGCGKPLAT